MTTTDTEPEHVLLDRMLEANRGIEPEATTRLRFALEMGERDRVRRAREAAEAQAAQEERHRNELVNAARRTLSAALEDEEFETIGWTVTTSDEGWSHDLAISEPFDLAERKIRFTYRKLGAPGTSRLQVEAKCRTCSAWVKQDHAILGGIEHTIRSRVNLAVVLTDGKHVHEPWECQAQEFIDAGDDPDVAWQRCAPLALQRKAEDADRIVPPTAQRVMTLNEAALIDAIRSYINEQTAF